MFLDLFVLEGQPWNFKVERPKSEVQPSSFKVEPPKSEVQPSNVNVEPLILVEKSQSPEFLKNHEKLQSQKNEKSQSPRKLWKKGAQSRNVNF